LWYLLPLLIAFMGVAWYTHGLLLEKMNRDFVHDRLHQEAGFLEREVRLHYPETSPSLSAGNYFEDVFHHAYAIKMGERVVVSPVQWEDALAPLLENHQTQLLEMSPENDSLAVPNHFLAFRKALTVAGQNVVILVAEDMTILREGQADLHLWTAVVSLGLLTLLLVLIFLCVNLALRPVQHLRQSLAELQDGLRDRLDDSAPVEFEPLTNQLNQLLDSLDKRLERSRQAIANLSHSVKTPIAAVRQVLADPQQELSMAFRDRLAERLMDIDRQLESEMRRARFAGSSAGKKARPLSQTRELIWMLSRLYSNINFEFESDLEEEHPWPIEEDDFSEIIGNLADNAGKWAKKVVLVMLHETREELRLSVIDDGPGIDGDKLNSLGTRGLRLDQQTHGHGLGLSIVRDLVNYYEGSIAFSRSRYGGLQVDTAIPLHPG